MNYKIGIICISVRDERLGMQVVKWVYEKAKSFAFEGYQYEIIDTKDYLLPPHGIQATSKESLEMIASWSSKMKELDGYIYVTPEYNNSIPGNFKNNVDYLATELYNKPVAFIGYGGTGATRAIEHHRSSVSRQKMATIGETVNFNIYTDFDEQKLYSKAHHATKLKAVIFELNQWAKALSKID